MNCPRISLKSIFSILITSLGALFSPTTGFAADETVNGNLTVTGNLVVEGKTANRKSFYLGGDGSTFYPVHFSDISWSFGEMDLQLYRSSVHIDSTWRGSLVARFQSHATHWGNQSEFLESSIRQYNNQFIADYSFTQTTTGIVIWLKGQNTYYYHVVGGTPTLTYNEVGNGRIVLRVHNGQDVDVFLARTTVSSDIETDGNHFSDNMRIDGNVGIGTSAASNSKLAVAGTIRAEEVIVETGWADYVFEDGYALPSLREVEAHIQEEGHLPGVPSSEAIVADGLSLGESQSLMMAKIEELTLYVIDLKKQNEEQQREMEALRSLASQTSK